MDKDNENIQVNSHPFQNLTTQIIGYYGYNCEFENYDSMGLQ